MFFSYLQILSILQLKGADVIIENSDSFRLVFSLVGNQSIVLDDQKFLCSAYDVFLLPPKCRLALCPLKSDATSFVCVVFQAQDNEFLQALSHIPLHPSIDCLTVRSCLLNLLNFYALQPSFYKDSIRYNVVSLLHYSYIATKNRASAATFLSGNTVFTPSPNEVLNHALNYIEEHLSEDISTDNLAETIHQSCKQVGDLFKYEYNCTVLQFTNRFRLFRAKELLCYTNYNITEISRMTGFKSIHYFSRYFKEKENMSPIEYKRAIVQMAAVHVKAGEN